MPADPLLLLAASGLAREVLAGVRQSATQEVVGFLDDDEARQGTSVDGVPVVGRIADIAAFPDAGLLVCAGSGQARRAIVGRLSAAGVEHDRFATFVHHTADVPAGCHVAGGSILLAGVVLTTAVRLGRHVVVMPHVTFTHDDEAADYVTACAGVTLGGSVSLGEAAYLGMGCSVRQQVEIGAEAVVGMGAVVLNDVAPATSVVGNPARPLVLRPGLDPAR